jgi:methionine-rich copper-binding protein CopC
MNLTSRHPLAASLGVLNLARSLGGRLAAAVTTTALAFSLLLATTSSAFAHARFDYADPPAGSALDGTPFILTAWFTQELTSKSTIRVTDANGIQVDLGDGHVNMDDPDRKMMQVSLPELPVGVYTVEAVADSAEDGHAGPTSFTFGVGMVPPAADAPDTAPAEAPAAAPAEEPAATPAEMSDTWWLSDS